MRVGYARVSTTGQSLDVQLEALQSAGCDKVFQEKQSGGTADDRAQLQQAIEFVRKDDILVVSKLDRLARSVFDLHRIALALQAKGVDLVVLDQRELDTTTRTGKLLFTLLGAIAEFERDLITERAAEGRQRAMQAGVKFGRKEKLAPEEVLALRRELNHWQRPKAELAEKYGISRASLYRILGAA